MSLDLPTENELPPTIGQYLQHYGDLTIREDQNKRTFAHIDRCDLDQVRQESGGEKRGEVNNDEVPFQKEPRVFNFSADKLHLLAQNTHHAVIVADKSGKVRWVNGGFVSMTGYSLRDMFGKFPGEILRGGESNGTNSVEIDWAVANGEYIRTETYNYKKSGEGYWSSLEILPVYNEQSEIDGFVSIQMDITEQRKRIELLNRREKQARMRADIGTILSDSKKPLRQTLQECSSAITEQLDPDYIGIWTCKTAGHIFEMHAGGGRKIGDRDYNDDPLFATLFRKTMIAELSGRNSPQVISDIKSYPWMIDRTVALSENLTSFIGCPLALDDTNLGVLAMYFETPLTLDMTEAVNSISDIIVQRLKREKAEEELRHAHFVLEMRVAERTGELVKAVEMMQFEVNERKRAEEELSEAQRFLRRIIDSLPNCIYVKDTGGKYVLVNEPFAQLFNITADQAIGKTAADFVPHEVLKKTQLEDEKIFGGIEEKYAYEEKLVDLLGKEYWMQAIKLPLLDAEGNPRYVLGIINDLTERKILEAQLQHSQKLESIGQLAAGIAHEINTPTQFVSDNTHFLREVFEEINPMLKKYEKLLDQAETGTIDPELIAEIRKGIEVADIKYLCEEAPKALDQTFEGVSRIAMIVKSMKDFAHPGNGEKQSVDLNRAIDSTLTVARNEWKYVADLKTQFDPNLPAVPCLLGEINQVILNMVINAAHAISELKGDTPDVKGKITVSTKNIDNKWAEIQIADTGAGIPPEVHARIFDPFFTTKEVGTGTGQGLAISHNVIVDKHGGRITFSSVQGEGTVFIIRLPLTAQKE